MRLSRRSFLTLALLLPSVAACSNGGGQATVTGKTREVTDVEGNVVKVPEKPQRIVALSEPTVDGLFALGITPIGITSGRGQQGISSYLADRGADIPILGNIGQPNFEAIGAAKPDLILVDGTSINNNPPVVDALRVIAPVVFTGYAGGDWRKNLRFTAEAVNKKAEGEQVIADYDAKAAQLSEDLVDFKEDTFSIVRWQGNSAALILKELPAGRALTDVGLKRPPVQDRNGRGHSEPVSAENLGDIDADFMFFGTLGGSSMVNPNAGGTADVSGAQKALEQARDLPGFSDLKAVSEDRVVLVDGAAWTSTGGPLLMNRILDDIRAALL